MLGVEKWDSTFKWMYQNVNIRMCHNCHVTLSSARSELSALLQLHSGLMQFWDNGQ